MKIRTVVSYDESAVIFHWGHGSGDDWTEVERKTYPVDTLPEGIRHTLLLYGLNKALSDRTSEQAKLVKDQQDPAPRIEAMDEVYNLFASNQWKADRSGGGASGVPVVVEAIAEVKGIDIPEAQRSWKATDEETREAIKANETVQAKMEEIRDRRKEQTETTDLSDLAKS